MSADPIIYCLEHLTDYRQFERLCSDIMAGTMYPNIEPVGGTGDRGRDALHQSKDTSTTTIFAYTVRADWRQKLHHDCSRIDTEKHNPNEIVFVCTSSLSGDQRDTEKRWAQEKYGWKLEFYDLERLRVLLTGSQHHLVAQHPAIFCPPWFSQRGGISISHSADTLVIDHVDADHAFAVWLARRLSMAGFRSWCYGTAPLAGENADDSIRTLIESRGMQYLPIISADAAADHNFMARAAIASAKDMFVLPCMARPLEFGMTFSKLFQTEPARFDKGWSIGLISLLSALESRAIKADLTVSQGQAIALRAYIPEPLIKLDPQSVYANVFPVKIPRSIFICELTRNMDDLEQQELRKSWAFVVASDKTLLAFDYPPKEVPLKKTKRLQEFAWDSFPEREGVKTTNAIKQLIRQSLEIACLRKGLVYCPDRRVYHFPDEENKPQKVSFTHVDGTNTWVGMAGNRQWGYGERATTYRYQLGPKFKVSVDGENNWWVTTRIYVRVTEANGTPFEDKRIGPRRKKVTKSWWNRQWFARTLGMMQFLRDDQNNENIEIGVGKRKVSIGTYPLSWECPIAIDVEAVDKIGDLHEELAAMSHISVEESEENTD